VRALIANFSGLGNGVAVVPLLRLLERTIPDCKYFHTENGVLANRRFARIADLHGLIGFTPSIWRRFARADWDAILRFCDKQSVGRILNLRNEGPDHDVEFYEFRARYAGRFEFLAPDLPQSGRPRPLVETLRKMIDPASDETSVDHEWLRLAAGADHAGNGLLKVVFFTGASVRQKRWSAPSWVELGIDLVDRGIAIIDICSGSMHEEAQCAHAIVDGLRRARPAANIVSRPAGSLWSLFRNFGQATVVVSNDTVATHLAAASGRRVVGLYLCTDPAIWAPVTRWTVACEAPTRRDCARLKPHAGNCDYYDCPLPGPCGASLEPGCVAEAVWAQVQSALSR
jgi:ADP-heptose:LPS heptosyltransferase